MAFGCQLGFAQSAKGDAKDKEAIAKNAEAFVAAFHKGDAKALAAFWTADGDYTDQAGGNVNGREAIEKSFTAFFGEHKGLKLRIESNSLRFVTPDVAIEDGNTAVISAEGLPPSRARYTIVHVKKDGQWLLSSVRDAPYAAPSNYEKLRGLEWAVGEWASEGDKNDTERLSVSWAENQNFIHATFSTTVKGITVGSAQHTIGWDPLGKKIRAWIFDATGGFGEGTWTQDDTKWILKKGTVLQDGKKEAGTYILTPVDAETITLQGKDRTLDGNKLPDTVKIKLKRVK
jgi:uncharacterized protein (TIGR02246 family)